MSGVEKYRNVLEHVQQLAHDCGRDPSEITVVAVSKTHSWEEVKGAYQEGCRHFGENRVQELLPKMEEAPEDVQWHLLGTLQKNKVRKVVGRCSLIHSVDSVDLAEKISDVSQELQLKTSILLQVNISGEGSKHGFSPSEIEEVVAKTLEMKGVNLQGLMTMAPINSTREEAEDLFSHLRQLRDNLSQKLPFLSMGMSQDYPEAISAGATHLRIGSSLFGSRT